MSDESAPTIQQYSAPPPCLVCGNRLLLRLARGRKSGKAFVMLRCSRDGRHYRAFINDREYVAGVLARLEGQTQASNGGDGVDLRSGPPQGSGDNLERGSGP